METNVFPRGVWQIGNMQIGNGTHFPIDSIESDGYTVNAGDLQSPRTNEIRFGQDTTSPSMITFNLGVINNRILPSMAMFVTPDMEDMIIKGRVAVEYLASEWLAEEVSKTPSAVKPMLYNINGRDKIIFGRPRQFATIPRGQDFYTVIASYQRMDSKSYGQTINEVPVPITDVGTVGATIDRDPEATAKTWAEVQINGPISNPKFLINDGTSTITIELAVTIAAGAWIKLVSNPWERRVVGSDGLNYSPKLLKPYLDEITLPALRQLKFTLNGLGTTAATSAVLRYREAYNTL